MSDVNHFFIEVNILTLNIHKFLILTTLANFMNVILYIERVHETKTDSTLITTSCVEFSCKGNKVAI